LSVQYSIYITPSYLIFRTVPVDTCRPNEPARPGPPFALFYIPPTRLPPLPVPLPPAQEIVRVTEPAGNKKELVPRWFLFVVSHATHTTSPPLGRGFWRAGRGPARAASDPYCGDWGFSLFRVDSFFGGGFRPCTGLVYPVKRGLLYVDCG